MEALKLKEEQKNKFQEQLKKLLTVDGYINIFSYEELLKSEPDSFKTVAAKEYKENEIKVRVLSSRTLIFIFIIGAGLLFGDTWLKYLGGIFIFIGIALFIYRSGHLDGYVWGHQIGFENGIDKSLCIDESLSCAIHEEILEIETGARG